MPPAPAPLWLRLAPAVFLLLWSAGFTFVKIGLAHAEPVTFLVVRYVLVLAVLVLLYLVLRPPLPSRPAEWGHLAVVGLLIQAVYFGLSQVAMAFGMSAGGLALVVSLQPILVALLAPRFAGEQVEARRWVGLTLGLAGAALVQYAAGLAATLPVALALEEMRIEWTGELLVALAYLVLANSLVSITLLLAMIRRGEVSRVSALFFLVPPTAALIAFGVIAAGGVAVAGRGAKP